MKLIVLRDENAKFFKNYWKKWYNRAIETEV